MKKKVGLAALTLTLALTLTGCFGGESDTATPPAGHAGGNSQPTSTPTDDATDPDIEPKALEIEEPTSLEIEEFDEDDYSDADRAARENFNTPLDVNIDETLEKFTPPEVLEAFGEEKIREGVEFSQEFYHDLVRNAEFYTARDSIEDYELLNTEFFADRMEKHLIEGIEEMAKAEDTDTADGSILGVIPATGEDGNIARVPGTGVLLQPTAVPMSLWGTPSVGVGLDGNGNESLIVHARRDITWTLTGGYTLKQETEYYIYTVPSGESWSISHLAYRINSRTLEKDGETWKV